MANTRLERLMNVVALLGETKRPLMLREIVSTVPGYPSSLSSARRAFERDKEDLRSMGFDIAVQPTAENESGYRIVKENTFFDVDLTPQQRNVVEYALSLYGPEQSVVEAAVTKLGGMNPENVAVDITSLPMPPMVHKLYDAAGKSNVLITFKNAERLIYPQRIIARAGYWYVQAVDLEKNESRTFRIDRISDVQKNDDPIPELSKSIHIFSDDESGIEFIVRVHPALTQQFCDTWSATFLGDDDTVHFHISRKELFLSRLWEYSGFVAVLAPQEIVEEINAAFDECIESLEQVS